MPQIKNKKFDLTRIGKIPSQVKNTKDFNNVKDFEKENHGVLPTLSIPKDLIEQFRKADQGECLLTIGSNKRTFLSIEATEKEKNAWENKEW